MRYQFTIAALALTVAPALAQISGSVVDDSGSPVANARVYYKKSRNIITDRTGHTRVTGPAVDAYVTTVKDGSFNVSGVPAGIYWLCADSLQQSQIRSCDWGFGSTKVDLTTAASASNVKLQVHSGVELTFVVDDAGNRIAEASADAAGPTSTGNFRIFVVNGTWFRPAKPVSAAAGKRQYSLTVPKSRSYRLLVDTKLSVLNQSQTAAGGTGAISGDSITVGAEPVTYNLAVR